MLSVIVEHQPLDNVTGEQVQWLFANVDKTSVRRRRRRWFGVGLPLLTLLLYCCTHCFGLAAPGATRCRSSESPVLPQPLVSLSPPLFF